MPTKLSQVAAILKDMSAIELEAVRSIAQTHIENKPAPKTCKFLVLPAELRDLIYSFAAIAHVRAFGNTQRSGLLSANKQIRTEFTDIFYSPRVLNLSIVTACHSTLNGKPKLTLTLTPLHNRLTNKALLDGDHNNPLHPIISPEADPDCFRTLPEAKSSLENIFQNQHPSGSVFRDTGVVFGGCINCEDVYGAKIYGIMELVEGEGEPARFRAFDLVQSVIRRCGMERDLEAIGVDLRKGVTWGDTVEVEVEVEGMD